MKWPDLLVSTKFRTLLFKNGKWSSFYEEENENEFYGITWSENEVFIATPKFIVRPKFSSGNKHHRIYNNISRDIHQIVFHKGVLYIANTSQNAFDTWNIASGELCSDIIKTAAVGDKNHYNSIFFDDNDHMWVCAHNNTKEPSFLEEYDVNFHRVRKIEEVGYNNHNVFVQDGFAYTQSSASGCMIKVDLRDDSKQTFNFVQDAEINPKFKFGRGMVKTKDCFIFGMNRWAPNKDVREHSNAYIVMVDNDLKFVKNIELPLAAQIKDIRAISERDYAHNNIPFPRGLV